MALSEDQKREMIRETHEAALVLVDDLQHIRAVLDKKIPTTGDIRRLSAQLRRILIDREITAIAAPRMGQVKFRVPDFSPVVEANEENPWIFVSAPLPKIFTAQLSSASWQGPRAYFPSNSFLKGETTDLRLDNFMSDKVVWYERNWFTRQQMLLYVAYYGQGVHFKGKPDAGLEALRHIRRIMTLSYDAKRKAVEIDINTPDRPIHPEAKIRAKRGLELPYLHMLATARYLTSSPDVLALEAIIAEEDDPEDR